MLDAEGYLSEYVHAEAQNLRAVKSYAKRLTGAVALVVAQTR